LEALEAKGLTLSEVEKLLPLADELNLLPLAVANKDLLLSLAPLVRAATLPNLCLYPTTIAPPVHLRSFYY
jgi:hypothetical protein